MPGSAVVVGGGVMGLAAARELRRRGHTVTLLERAQPGRAASWASAGIIGATLRVESDPHQELRRVSRGLWPAFAETLTAESGLDPEYREMGCIQLATNEAELDALARAAKSLNAASSRDADGSRARGVNTPDADGSSARGANSRDADGSRARGATLLGRKELMEIEPAVGPSVPGGLLVPGGNVDNRRLCKALEIAVRRAGVTIETGAEVRALVSRGQRVTGVETAARRVNADFVVLAAGAWSATIRNVEPRIPVGPQRGQILALDQSSVGIKHVLLAPGDPYFVPRADGRLVIGATREEAGWDASITAGGIAWLLNRAMEVVPALEDCRIAEIWTGFRPLCEDGLPIIGRGAWDGLYFLTGHGPSGIAPLPGSVALLMALIEGEPPPLSPRPFDPLRFRR